MLGDQNCPLFGTRVGPWVPRRGQAWWQLEPTAQPPPKLSLSPASHPPLHAASVPQRLWRGCGVGGPKRGAWTCPRTLRCRDSRADAEDMGVNKDRECRGFVRPWG